MIEPIQDKKLPFLSDFLDNHFLETYLADHLDIRKPLKVKAEVVKYKPGRRCVIRYRVVFIKKERETTIHLIGKVMRKQRSEKAFGNYEVLYRHWSKMSRPHIRIPRPLFQDGDLDFFAIEEILQPSFARFTSPEMRRWLPPLAVALAEWHRQSPENLSQLTWEDWHRKYLAKPLEKLTHYPVVARKADSLAARVAEVMAKKGAGKTLVHGDLSFSHILPEHDAISLIDLDGAGIGAPEHDLAWLYVQFTLAARPAELAEGFLTEYQNAGGSVNRRVLNALVAFYYLRKLLIECRRNESPSPGAREWFLRQAEIHLNN